MFEGVCIAKKNAGINSSFTVRKISYGEGIERVLPLFSPQINKIELSKQGNVRRSKLYYLRSRSGKSARISEKNTFINDAEKNNEKVKGNAPESKLVESVEATSKKTVQEDSVKVKPSKSEEKQ